MLYERSRQIENRLDALLRLIQTGRHSTPALAAALDISIPTVSRAIDALRGRGYPIRAVREDNRWYYALDPAMQASMDSIRRESREAGRTLGQ